MVDQKRQIGPGAPGKGNAKVSTHRGPDRAWMVRINAPRPNNDVIDTAPCRRAKERPELPWVAYRIQDHHQWTASNARERSLPEHRNDGQHALRMRDIRQIVETAAGHP